MKQVACWRTWITRTARIDPKRYQDVVNSHGSALEEKIARYQQVYDDAQTLLDNANQRVGTLQGEEKEKLKREMHSCNTRKTAQRIEVEKACRSFVSDMSAMEQDLKTRFPALKDRDLKAGILSKEDVAKAVAT